MSAKFDSSLIPPSPNLSFEISLRSAGATMIAGLDEAGRGAWAGPVTAAAVVLPIEVREKALLGGVRDSKQLTPAQRSALEPVINWLLKPGRLVLPAARKSTALAFCQPPVWR